LPHEQTIASDVTLLSRSSKIGEADQLDNAGQTIRQLVERAGGVAEKKQHSRWT